MKKFSGHKNSQTIIDQCTSAGIEVDSTKYDAGGDHLVVYLPGATGEPVKVLYNTASGHFFGEQSDGTRFSSDQNLDFEPWFESMLNFFYVEAVAA